MRIPRVVQVAAPVLIMVGLMLPLRGGFTDDGFIHIQYAQNLITRGEYSFNPGEVSYGTTSPLWVLTLSVLGLAFGDGERLITISRILSWIGGILAMLLMMRLGRGMGLAPANVWLGSLAVGAHAWMARWTALGMETAFAVAAMVGIGVVGASGFESRRGAMWLGFLMAVAALLRPEAYLLVVVYVLVVVIDRPNRRLVGLTLAVYGVLIGPWLLFARFHLGSLLPNTAGAKSGGLVLEPRLFLEKLVPIVQIVGVTEGLFVIAVIIALFVSRGKTRILSKRYRLPLLWIVALPLAYVLFDIQVLSRYMLLTTPFVITMGLAASEDIAGRFRATPFGVTAASAVVNVVFYFAIVLGPSQAFSRDLTTTLKRLALFVEANSSEDAVVAAGDIGYLAFYSGRRVLDLGGLVDRSTHELRERYTYDEIVEAGMYLDLVGYPKVDYFIDRERVANRFGDMTIGRYRLERIRVDRVDNLGIRKPGPYFYTLYRLHAVGDD